MREDDNPLVRRLGVMGGSFDPIHVGHMVAASEAMGTFDLDRVLFVPTGRPWHKRSYSDAEDRFMMTTLAAATHPRFAASRIELDRKGTTYTADTMEALRDFYGVQVKLFFLLGADAAIQLPSWHEIDRLVGLTDMIAITRTGFDLTRFETIPNLPRVRVMEMPAIDISSTEIRARVRAGRPIDYLVPTGVADYIRARGLYFGEGEAKGA